jgi:hypothetical protein
MNRIQKIVIGATMAGSALAGGAIGAALLNGSASAQTSTSTTAPAASTAPAANGAAVDNSNKEPAHEAAESPQRAADEAAGKVGGGREHGNHVSNKDPAHEAAESPARATEEASRDAAIANGSTTTTAP